MKAVIDTHALYWALVEDTKELSPKALEIINDSESLILPSIVLLELLGLLQKKGKLIYFDKFIRNIPKSKYIILPLDLATIKETRLLKKQLELHDRVIVAAAKMLDLPLITRDEKIMGIYKKVIW